MNTLKTISKKIVVIVGLALGMGFSIKAAQPAQTKASKTLCQPCSNFDTLNGLLSSAERDSIVPLLERRAHIIIKIQNKRTQAAASTSSSATARENDPELAPAPLQTATRQYDLPAHGKQFKNDEKENKHARECCDIKACIPAHLDTLATMFKERLELNAAIMENAQFRLNARKMKRMLMKYPMPLKVFHTVIEHIIKKDKGSLVKLKKTPKEGIEHDVALIKTQLNKMNDQELAMVHHFLR